VIIFSLVILVAYGFVFWRIYTDGLTTSDLLNQASLDFEKDEALRNAKIALAENRDSISKIDSYFIAGDGVAPFIGNIEALGKQYGVGVSIGSVAVESDPKMKNDFKETLHLKVETTGSWSNIVRFLSAVENLPYHVVLDQVVFGLTDAADKLSFGGVSAVDSKRVRTSSEKWKVSLDISLLKFKQ